MEQGDCDSGGPLRIAIKQNYQTNQLLVYFKFQKFVPFRSEKTCKGDNSLTRSFFFLSQLKLLIMLISICFELSNKKVHTYKEYIIQTRGARGPKTQGIVDHSTANLGNSGPLDQGYHGLQEPCGSANKNNVDIG